MSTSTENSQVGGTPPTIDRAAALAAGPAKIPRRFVLIALAVAAALSLGGVLVEHLASNAGLNPVATTLPPAPTPTTLPSGSPQLSAGLPAFMSIDRLSPAPAPAISLDDQKGRLVSLARERPKVVVLTFFNSSCSDVCPVLESEIAKADADLGRESAKVVFLTVNTDPLSPTVNRAAQAVVAMRPSRLTNWYLLGGPLSTLKKIWIAYGVHINVYLAVGIVAHNDVMYFIDPAGRLRYRATPYSNENTQGVFSLPPADVARWGVGIAAYARQLLRPAA